MVFFPKLLRRRIFAAMSWRAEAHASNCVGREGLLVRQRYGQIMTWAKAHSALPDITGRAAILCLHGVIAHRPDPEVEQDALELRNFRRLLRVLDKSFNVISLAELVAAIKEGYSPPPRSIVITFDDGYVTNHSVAAEELGRLRMPWSAFLPAQLIETGQWQWTDDLNVMIFRGGRDRLAFRWQDRVLHFALHTPERRQEAMRTIREACRYLPDHQRQDYLQQIYAQFSLDELQTLRARYPDLAPMSWRQARELKAAGVDVGSHGLSHIALAPQQPSAIVREIGLAHQIITERLGEDSPHFSYPYGREASVSAMTDAMLREKGYDCALTLEQNGIDCREANLLRLPRLIVSPLIGRVLFGLWQRFIR